MNNYQIPLTYLPRRRRHGRPSSGRKGSSVRDGKVLIVSHGNACNLAEMQELLEDFRKSLHVAVIGYEYIGYNHTRKIPDSQGDRDSACNSCFSDKHTNDYEPNPNCEPHLETTPKEKYCYESIDAAHKFITEELGIPEHRQVWLGISIGGGPTIDLVSRLNQRGLRVGGMILVSPFYSATRVVSEFLAFFYDLFPNYAKMDKVQAQTLILHGSADEVIPPDHSKRLESHYLGTGCQRHLIEGAGHNDILAYQETFDHIQDFLAHL